MAHLWSFLALAAALLVALVINSYTGVSKFLKSAPATA